MTCADHGERHGPQLLIVLVLYRMSPEASPAFQSLVDAVKHVPASSLRSIVYDNSPEAHTVSHVPFALHYHHDPSNPGLAVAYQFALEHASRDGIPWLLLLDQDTVVTPGYLAEALQTASELEPLQEIGAIVPKLLEDSQVLSPHWPHGKGSTRSFGDRDGLLEPDVCVYNSGSLLRVKSICAAGGFPREFPLDYLDHATFARLRARGQRVFLLHAALSHRLESKEVDVRYTLHSSPRLCGMLAAETRFYREYGSRRDRLLLFRRRAKMALGMLRRAQFRSLAALLRCTAGYIG